MNDEALSERVRATLGHLTAEPLDIRPGDSGVSLCAELTFEPDEGPHIIRAEAFGETTVRLTFTVDADTAERLTRAYEAGDRAERTAPTAGGQRFNVAVEAHIPRGSGDAGYRIFDADSDNGDVLAIIDPNMTMDDPCAFAEHVAEAINRSSMAAYIDRLNGVAPKQAADAPSNPGHPTIADWRYAVIKGETPNLGGRTGTTSGRTRIASPGG